MEYRAAERGAWGNLPPGHVIPPSQLAEDGPRKVRKVLLIWLSHSIYVICLLILILTWTCLLNYHWTLLIISTWICQNEIEMIKI